MRTRLGTSRASNFFAGRWLAFCLLAGISAWASTNGPRFERITTAEGLSQGTVLAILQDRHGFMWFGTQDGLNKYDGYKITVYRHDPNRSDSLSSNSIFTLLEDADGFLWVGTSNGGLNRFDPGSGVFKRYAPDPERPDSLVHHNVTALFIDGRGRFWVGTHGGLSLFDRDGDTFQSFVYDPDDPTTIASNSIIRIFEDSQGRLWIGTNNGLCLYDHLRKAFVRYPEGSESDGGLSGNQITGIVDGPDGKLWVGTFGGGLTLLDPTGNTSRHFRAQGGLSYPTNDDIRHLHVDREGRLWVAMRNGGVDRIDLENNLAENFRFDPGDNRSLSHDEVRFIMEDRTGLMWLGTMSGINKLDPRSEKFIHLRQRSGDEGSLSHNRVKAIFEDRLGTLWVGTFGGGLNRRDPGEQEFRHYRMGDGSGLESELVSSIFEDGAGTLWMGTENGLHRYLRSDDQFKNFRADQNNPTSISHNRIRGMLEDSRGSFWVSTLGGGLNRFDREAETFLHIWHDKTSPQSLPHNNVYVLMEDDTGTIWVGMQGGGLATFDGEAPVFRHYPHQAERQDSLSHNAVWSLLQDSSGTIWVGTAGGLNRLNPDRATFTRFREQDGLPNDVIYGILEDAKGNLWLSTNRGICRFEPGSGNIRKFTPSDGLQDYEFNGGALFRARNGRMYFGGPNGVTAFFPKEVDRMDPFPPQLAITDFLLFNQSVLQNEDSKSSLLDQPLPQVESVRLQYNQNLFSLEFAALHYGNPKQNRYAYQLEGIDDDWVHTSAEKRFATYTKIPAGDYTFRLKASNRDGIWTEEARALRITVRPAPWLTWWAYTGYALVIALIIFAYVTAQRRKLANERAINQRLQQVDRLKDEFLANTSHELRTPLHGIIGIAESLIDGAAGPLDEGVRANLAMVVSSGKRLANLVNDILDFSKLKNKNLDVRCAPMDIYSMVDVVLTLSQPLAHAKKLILRNEVPGNLPPVLADENRVQQILHNLVGNSIKFTEQGQISISAETGEDAVQISVTDTGIGIPETQQKQVFRSFEQLDSADDRAHGGTGLGLAISKQLVELQGGRIWLASRVGEGSKFTFTLPICSETEAQQASPPPALTDVAARIEAVASLPDREKQPDQGFEILIADDDQVNRQVLVNHLKLQNYRLTEAASGQEVLDALQNHPGFDLILLDIMMPRMSGYEVCKKVRERYPVQDLPIIFLTAKDRLADIVAGFAVGANDYLTKPVAKDELLSRVHTHLQLLDINRHLEEKVAQRTLELERKTSEILRTQNQLLMQEKLASMGTLTAGIAHEIKNPLNFVKNFAELTVDLVNELSSSIAPIKAGLPAGDREELESLTEDIRHNLNRVHEHGKRANRIVENMMNMAGNTSSERRTIDANYVVNEFTNMAYHGVRAKNLKLSPKIHMNLDEGLGVVEVVPQDLGRAIANLVNNALDAMNIRLGDDPEYKPELWVQTKNQGEFFSIVIRDNAEGIPEENLERVFNPFFTTRPVDSGHIGLGLSIAYDIIVQGHHGEMDLDAKVGEYTEIRARIPKAGTKA